MFDYALILLLLGTGVTGWLGYTHTNQSKALKRCMAERNAYYDRLRLAKKTSANHDAAKTKDENLDFDDG